MQLLSGVIILLVFILQWNTSDSYLKVSIYPSEKHIVFQENEDLNLTCKVSFLKPLNISYDFTWKLPIKMHDNHKRVSLLKGKDELTIIVHKLQEEDSGIYICEVSIDNIFKRQQTGIIVRTGKNKCHKSFFSCGDGLCIPWNYVCDGYEDCPNRFDESVEQCGPDPCFGKFLCDGRCIPKNRCCNPIGDSNCTASYYMPCCHKLFYADIDSTEFPVQYKYENINFYNSALYTMISCTIAFVCMSAILLCSIYRYQILHESRLFCWQRFWSQMQTGSQRRVNIPSNLFDHTSLRDEELSQHINQNTVLDPSANFVFCTFDHASGVQIAEYGPPEPPPYSECADPPPPPYTSTVDITTASEETRTITDVHSHRVI